jgi:hypothetical protein
MLNQSGHATVVSNNSSRNSFVGLVDAKDASNWQNMNDKGESNGSATTKTETNSDQSPTNSTSTSSSQHTTMNSSYPQSLIVSKSTYPILPSAGLAVPTAPSNNTVPEFLYQLTKMLTGGHNDIIEWSNGTREVYEWFSLDYDFIVHPK